MKPRIGSTTAILGMVLVAMLSFGCAATKPSSDPWIFSFIGSPDDVWTASHIVLVELNYDVESENRQDGLISAVRPGAAEGSTEVLSLDQVMRTNDVKVYVRAAAGPDQPAMDFSRKEALAKEYLALLNGLLYK